MATSRYNKYMKMAYPHIGRALPSTYLRINSPGKAGLLVLSTFNLFSVDIAEGRVPPIFESG